jgi:isopentenyldiphosphate isomerase
MHSNTSETPSDEIFEIFNERNEKIGIASRKDVHREGYFHRSVHVFIVNSNKQILMQKRVSHKDVAPNAWDLSVCPLPCPHFEYLFTVFNRLQNI